MKNNKGLVRGIVLFLMYAYAGAICFYIWSNDSLNSMKYIPMYIMLIAVLYILFQMMQRYVFKRQNWWDWLYYIGLLSIVAPRFLVTQENIESINLFADLAVLFLIIPLLFDTKQLLTEKNKR